MDILVFVPLVLVLGWQFLKVQEQRRRIILLGTHLSRHQVEQHMQRVMQGYQRALEHDAAAQREAVWRALEPAEQELSEQFSRFAADFARVWGDQALISTLPLAFPYADRLFPRQTFDARALMQIHAEGIAAVARNEPGLSLRDKAYTMTAELLLMQHSCHWFCRSRAVADARVVAHHQTSHAQILAAVTPATREAYRRLTGV
ncbi:MAG: hypothetical protein ACK4MJ_06145 [Hylemonella sp.]